MRDRRRAPQRSNARRTASDNHPTPDHILPLFVAMGAGARGDCLHAKRLHASTTYAVLAMDVYAFDGEESVAV
jgi:4,5-DOPA dioxygenase extradiol